VQNMGIEPGTNMTEAFTEIMHLITRYWRWLKRTTDYQRGQGEKEDAEESMQDECVARKS
jgi:hypothetical protein